MKVLLVIDRLTNPHAGTEGQFLLLIKLLQQAHCEIKVIILAPSDWLAANPLPCETVVIGCSSIKSPKTWWRIYCEGKLASAAGFKLAHIFFNDASVVCPPMFHMAGINSIISRRDMGFWYNKIYRFILPLTGRFIACALSNSNAVAKITGEVERIPQKKLRVIYNGFNREVSSGVKIPELESIKSSGVTILGLVANIRPIKRIEDAIRALSLLDRENRPHLVIIGAGDPTDLKVLSKSLGVDNCIHFMGSRSDIPDCLSYFSAGLLCSESEGFSNAIIEYQFAGLPVICSETGGNPEAVTHDQTGWLYPVGDVNALRECMKTLLAFPYRAQAMGVAAKREAESRYTIDAMLNQHLALYHELISAGELVEERL